METTHNYLTGLGDVQRLLLEWNNWTQQKATAFLLGSSALFLGTNYNGERGKQPLNQKETSKVAFREGVAFI